MSKELEAFRDILGILSAVSGCEVDMNSERVKIVEQALQRLEAIDNANPSEALEEIKTLRGFNQVELNNDKNINKSLNAIEQALLKAQEEHRALEILTNHIDIELNYFDNSLHVADYNLHISKEEFNLLREILK